MREWKKVQKVLLHRRDRKVSTFSLKDANMEEARNKILAVLKEHDLMGCVTMAGKERGAFFSYVSPSWSCAIVEEDGEKCGVRIRSKREDYPSLQAQEEQVRFTINGIMGLMHNLKFIEQLITAIIQLIGQKQEIRHIAQDQVIQKATEQ